MLGELAILGQAFFELEPEYHSQLAETMQVLQLQIISYFQEIIIIIKTHLQLSML